MKNIVEYLKDNFNVDGFIILNMSDDSLVSRFTEGELLKAIGELKKLKAKDNKIEYWLVASTNGGFYDLEDTGNYLVIKSIEINDRDDKYGINPKFNEYMNG